MDVTAKRAIEILALECEDWETSHCTPYERKCAFDMAIEALKKEVWKEEHPVSPLCRKTQLSSEDATKDPTSDLISRADAIDALEMYRDDDFIDIDEVISSVGHIPIVHECVKDADCISRAEAIRIASGYCHPANIADELRRLPSAQPDVPDMNVGDLISRQAAIDALDKRFDSIPMEQTVEICLLRRDLRELPSAQPERKKGRWIYDVDCLICSECGKVYTFSGSNFCPNCGADMRGEQG